MTQRTIVDSFPSLSRFSIYVRGTNQFITPDDPIYCKATPLTRNKVRLQFTFYYSNNKLTLLIERKGKRLYVTVERYEGRSHPRLNYEANLYYDDRRILSGIGGVKSHHVGSRTSVATLLSSRPKPKPKPKVTLPKPFTLSQPKPLTGKGGRTTIIVATPDITRRKTQACISHIRKNTQLEHRLIIVETHFKETFYNHPRDMNIALKAKQSNYYVLMNDDLYVDPGWLDALIAVTQQDPNIGVVGGLWLYPDRKKIQHAGGFFRPKWPALAEDAPFHRKIGHRFQNRLIQETPDALKQVDCFFVTGACVLITNRCASKVGHWDERLNLSYNDVEYGPRAWLKGFRVVYTPLCHAVHEEGGTIRGGLWMQKTSNYYLHSIARIEKKWGDGADWLKAHKLVKASNKKHYPHYLPPF